MPNRRRNPNGHLRRHPDTVEERWQAIVKYPDPDKPGAWKQRSKTFEHKADAQEWLDLALVEHRRKPGYRPPSNETYGAFLTRWLDIVVDGSGNKLSTRIRYRQNAAHIQRMLGDRPLLQVSAQDIQQMYTQLKTKGLSPRTIHHVHLRTRASLATAVDWGLIPSNPALAVRPPRVRRSAIDPPTPEAVARFLQQASNHWLYALWAFLATTGVRKGEALGLRWTDIDWQGRTAYIQHTLAGEGPQRRLESCKTLQSERRIDLSEEYLLPVLRKHCDQQKLERRAAGQPWDDTLFVFGTQRGTWQSPSNVQRMFKRLLKAAGLPSTTRIHDLRHAMATHWLSNHVTDAVVAERLGHRDPAVTHGIYSHAVKHMQAEAANRLDAILLGVTTASPRTDEKEDNP